MARFRVKLKFAYFHSQNRTDEIIEENQKKNAIMRKSMYIVL